MGNYLEYDFRRRLSASCDEAVHRWPRRNVVVSALTLLVGGLLISNATVPAFASVVSQSALLSTVPEHVVNVSKLRVAKTPSKHTIVSPQPDVAIVATVFANTVPSANVSPSPNFLVAGASSFVNGIWTNTNPCVVGSATGINWPAFTDDPACNEYVLAAINNARAIEGVKAMVLPSNWYQLTLVEQLFVVADLERVDRGLPPYLGINSTLSANAIHAAQTTSDPTTAAGFAVATDAQGDPAMGGAWSGGYSVLAADYFWMYADGWAGSAAATANVACTSAHAPGCWAHRLELLGSDPGFNPGVGLDATNAQMGVGFAMVQGAASYVDLIEVPEGPAPAMSFTWAADVRPFLG